MSVRLRKTAWLTVGTLVVMMVLLAGASYGQKARVRFLHTQVGDVGELWEAIPRAYEILNPNVKVEVTYQQQQIFEDYGLNTALEGPTPPDIYTVYGDYEIGLKAAVGYAADVEDFAGPWKDRFSKGTVDLGEINGRLYGIPSSVQTIAPLWYNKGYFDKFGLTEPKTWDELARVCQVLRDNDIAPMAFGNAQLWMFGNWSTLTAARLVGFDKWTAIMRLEEKFSQPDFVSILTLFQEMGEAGYFNRDMNAVGPDKGVMDFFRGKGGMFAWSETILVYYLAEQPEGFELGVLDDVPAPPGAKEPKLWGLLPQYFLVNGNSEYIEAAVDFLKFFTNGYNSEMNIERGLTVPVTRAQELATVHPLMKKLYAPLAYATALIEAPDEQFPVEVAEVWYEGAALAALGEKTPEEIVEWMDRQLEALR